MITDEQITITSDLIYKGNGLALSYEVGSKTGFSFLPDVKIMNVLQKEGYITEYNVQTRTVCPRQDTPVSMEYFMTHNLDMNMAQKLLADHLNSRTSKPITK